MTTEANPPERRRFQPTFWATVCVIPALAILVGLGSWQVQRLIWKLDIISTIQARLAAPTTDVPLSAENFDAEGWDYRHVSVTGEFDHGREIHMYAQSITGIEGYQIITPMMRSGAVPVMVNRGWVPLKMKSAEARLPGQVTGVQTVTGIIRKPWSKGLFMPDNDPRGNLWFYGDLTAMGQHLGVVPMPVFVALDEAPVAGGFPRGGQTRVYIRNQHLVYILTWYALAIALGVIFYIYHLREVPAGDDPG